MSVNFFMREPDTPGAFKVGSSFNVASNVAIADMGYSYCYYY